MVNLISRAKIYTERDSSESTICFKQVDKNRAFGSQNNAAPIHPLLFEGLQLALGQIMRLNLGQGCNR
ncbi:MAG: hypothetical protein RL230_1402 [Pseudomonadota bacterium]|jgi:hypothetical protein